MTLSDWMIANGFDDERFGGIIKADRVTISRIRRGINRPSWGLAARINAATDGAVAPHEFLPKLPESAE